MNEMVSKSEEKCDLSLRDHRDRISCLPNPGEVVCSVEQCLWPLTGLSLYAP